MRVARLLSLPAGIERGLFLFFFLFRFCFRFLLRLQRHPVA
jgi:hypothetical protein